MHLTLTERIKETDDIESFIFDSDSEIAFIPGQYLRYTLPHEHPDNRGINRYFTIAAAPSEKNIRITTRFAEQSSSFKQALRRMKIGDTIEASNPGGAFTYQDNATPAIFIAGGIGITPFRSMVREALLTNTKLPVTLLYSANENQFVFKELFNEYQNIRSTFSAHFITGRIDESILKEHTDTLVSSHFYISGPKPMVDSINKILTDTGVEKESIKLDFFPGY